MDSATDVAAGYLQKRKGKYMAQVLEKVEEGYIALLADEHSGAVDDYRYRLASTDRAVSRTAFEDVIVPLLPAGAGAVIQDVKGLVRARMNALCVDAVDLFKLEGEARINGAAQELRDRLHPEGRPQGVRIT